MTVQPRRTIGGDADEGREERKYETDSSAEESDAKVKHRDEYVYHVHGNLYNGPVYFGDAGPDRSDPTVSRAGAQESDTLPRLQISAFGNIDEAIQRLQDEVKDQEIISDIKSSVLELRNQVAAWTDEAVKEKDQRLRLYSELQRAERKGRTQFLWGLALAVPLGVIGSVIAWLLGIN